MRLYQIPVGRDCGQSCNYCPGIGARSESKTLQEFSRSVSKAKFGQYDAVYLPCNFLYLQNFEEYLDVLHREQCRYVLGVNTRYIDASWMPKLSVLSKELARLRVVIDGDSSKDFANLEFIDNQALSVAYTLVIRREIDTVNLIRTLPDGVRSKLTLCAPHKFRARDPYLKNRELYKLLRKIDIFEQYYEISPSDEIDLFEPRVHADTELEPEIRPTFEATTANRDVRVSVVIPTYNNDRYVLSTLRHLCRQQLSADAFEVIIVDDGSTDDTMPTLREYIRSREQEFNIKYIHFPRKRTREMGDAQFRAGVARNLGVKNAEGELLVFLDSDILTPSNYLGELIKAHEHSDLVQTERIYLKKSVCTDDVDFETIDFSRDTYLPGGDYWESFYRSNIPWNKIPFGWKYVCTYGLSIKKDLFKSLGWFKKNYVFYGFEDTDFGYRAWNAKLKCEKIDLKCLHLYHETERSEFSNSEYKRYQLLKKSARIMFHNCLDPEVYEHFGRYVDDGIKLRELAFRVSRWLASSTYIRN